jgi:hypothetical protein
MACRVVGMNRSTHRLQKTRHPSNQEVRRMLLADTITELHLASRVGTVNVIRRPDQGLLSIGCASNNVGNRDQ